MSSDAPITEIYDIGQIVSTELFKEEFFSPLIDLTITDKRIHIYLKDDIVLSTIEIDLESRKIRMRSPSIDLFDLISELYPTSRKRTIKKLLGEGKSWEYILGVVPELQKTHVKRARKAEKIGEKYGIDFEVKIDQDGHEYLVLNLELKDLSIKHIREMLSLGLTAFKEYSYEMGSADQLLIKHLDREFYKSELIQILGLTKRIIQEILHANREPSIIMVSNYDETQIRILIETEKKLKDEILILRNNQHYIIKMKKTSEDGHEIHSKKVNNKQNLIRWIENELKRPSAAESDTSSK